VAKELCAFRLNNVKTHPRYDEAQWFYLMNVAGAAWNAGIISTNKNKGVVFATSDSL
jgi:hypothetical protein